MLDGTTLQIPHSPELVHAYPPPRNQHGASHWPLIRMVVLQDVQTGWALRPHWGPMTESEQALALQAISHLPAGAVLIGDRNFGVFGLAWTAHQRGHAILMRLTQERAEHLAGGPVECPLDRHISWHPTRWDRCGGPYPDEVALECRLICLPASQRHHPQPLYFVTTLDLPPERIRDLYGLRWNVETDLRSIKRTVHLQQLSSRSVAMLEKELLLALAAYNLVRAVICLAAEGTAASSPHQLHQRLHPCRDLFRGSPGERSANDSRYLAVPHQPRRRVQAAQPIPAPLLPPYRLAATENLSSQAFPLSKWHWARMRAPQGS